MSVTSYLLILDTLLGRCFFVEIGWGGSREKMATAEYSVALQHQWLISVKYVQKDNYSLEEFLQNVMLQVLTPLLQAGFFRLLILPWPFGKKKYFCVSNRNSTVICAQ